MSDTDQQQLPFAFTAAGLEGLMHEIAGLITAPALPLGELCRQCGIAEGTMAAIRQRDEGPETFVIGRRVYVTREAWAAWLRQISQRGGVSVHARKHEAA